MLETDPQIAKNEVDPRIQPREPGPAAGEIDHNQSEPGSEWLHSCARTNPSPTGPGSFEWALLIGEQKKGRSFRRNPGLFTERCLG